MKRYFKREAESELGAGMAYMEITDQLAEPPGGSLRRRVAVG